MASVGTGALLLALFLLPVPQSTATTLYVTPSPHTACPSTPCHLLSQYIENATEYFLSNTTMIFLPGKHTFNVMANVTSVTGFSLVGGSENTSTIVCSGLRCGGFYFDNVTGLNVTQLSFVSDSHSITTKDVHDFHLVNCTFANSSNTALIANNSNLLIEGNTFINNTGGNVQQMTFIPGGGIAVVTSSVTLQGQNNFVSLACTADICGGGAMYAENSTVDLAGNTTFINNTATSTTNSSLIGGGGGLLLLNTAVSITGYVDMTNNSVSSTYSMANECEVGGGGALLILCTVAISGRIELVNNFAKGQSGCGGGMHLYNCSVVINGSDIEDNIDVLASSTNGNVLLRSNYAGYAGGGIYMQNGNMAISETVSLISNSVGYLGNPQQHYGGGIAIFGGGYMSISGNLLLTDSFTAYAGGGIHVQSSSLAISGTTTLINNSAGFLGYSCSPKNPEANYSGGGINMLNGDLYVTGSLSLTDGYAGGQGGGLNAQWSTINITGTMSLANNSADNVGGGILFDATSMTVSGNVSFTNNSVSCFSCTGGGIFVYNNSNVTLKDAIFANNYACLQGGGLAAQVDSTILMTGKVSFINNSANAGGGILLTWSTMEITTELSLTQNSAHQNGGGISIFAGRMSVSGSVILADNSAYGNQYGKYGGGMDVRDTIITVTGTMSFVNNSADLGGGIYFDVSNMTISGKVYFVRNNAIAGGAIFVKDPSSLVYCSSIVGAACVQEDCFFQIGENASLHQDLMVFEDNMAGTGSVLLGGSVDKCVLEGHPEVDSGHVFDTIANYSMQPHTVSVITSDPYRVCVCNNSQPCSAYTAYAYPGQTIPLTVAAVGQRNGTAPARINAITNPSRPSNKSTLGMFEDRQYIIYSQCTDLHYTFFSNLPKISLVLYVHGSCSSLDGSKNRLQIPVHLLPCPPAFSLSHSTQGCVCENRLQKYTKSCDINNQTILRDGDFWVGYDNQSKSQGLVLHPHCPFDYCQMKSINFTMNDTDKQCSFNRTGLLCGACLPGLSLALGSSRCLPCSDAYLTLLLPFAIMGLALVAFMLLCRLTVALGTISGLIFYANIVGANQSVFFPPGNFQFLRVFISWLNLDLGIETCFCDGMDAYVKTWLQFVFPIYIWGVIGLIMFISARFPRVSRMLGSNPVAVLATLFLLSYAKILRAIISALSLTTLEYPRNKIQVVWLSDANIGYLHGKHIPLFVVGILFLVLIFLPYTLLLLLGQWLQKFSHIKILSWMNNLKLKAFLEAYYAPYMIKHRYWTGLLLVARLILLPVFAVNVLGDNSENLLAISAASFGLLVWPCMIGSVYKNWKLGALNTSYILNLGIFAVATNYVQQAGGNQVVVSYISTGVAFVTFFATVLGHMYLQIKGTALSKKLCCKTNERPDDQHAEVPVLIPDPQTRPLIAPSTTYVGYGVNQFREPLLDAQ